MKKKVIYLLPIFFFSCATNNCVKTYMKDEIAKNSNSGTVSVLIDKKPSTSGILNTYIGRKRGNMNTQAKTFDQKSYAFLVNKHKNDTLVEFWSKKESADFGFYSLIKSNEISKYRDSVSHKSNVAIYSYSLSKPIFINKNKQALFSIFMTANPKNVIEDCVIVMKKENGKWVLAEKVYNSALH